MKDIYCKAKTIIEDNWVYGYYCFTAKRRNAGGQVISDSDFDTYYIVDNKGRSNPVNRNTVCEYTGATDIENKKAFTNDIIELINNFNYLIDGYGIIYFDDELLQYYVKSTKSCSLRYIDGKEVREYKTCPLYKLKNHFRVIGTVFDNPELSIEPHTFNSCYTSNDVLEAKRLLLRGYRFAARDKDKRLYAYEAPPTKLDSTWGTDFDWIEINSNLFTMLDFSDNSCLDLSSLFHENS